MKGYRFFGSSLLIIYDGCDTRKPIDVRLIDFAKCVTRTEMTEQAHDMTFPPEQSVDQPDLGYIHGLHTLIETFQTIAIRHFSGS